MPGNAARYYASKAARFRCWLRRLTLWQYALFMGVTGFIACFGAATLLAADAWPSSVHHSWASNLLTSAVLSVMLTAFYTWHRREDFRQDITSEHYEDDGKDR